MQTATTAITATATADVPKEAVTPAAKKVFLRYIHSFRGIAIIFVVAGHVLLRWADGSPTHTFFRTFWENGTVLFVFMAGYLFQHLSRKFEYKDYLTKKFLNVILPYLVVSTPIIIMRLIQHDYPGVVTDLHPDFDSWGTLNKIAYFIFHGAHLQQLWFVPMITIVYFLAPVLLYIDRHPKLYLVLLLLVPVSLIVPREPFIDIPRMFAHLISVYVFGMLLSHYKDAYLEWAKKYWLPLTLVTAVAFGVNLYYFDELNGPLNYVHKMLFCLCFIYWLWKLDKYIPKVIGLLAELSFGIFFVHYYVLLAIRAVYWKTMGEQMPGNILNWAISLIIGLAGSVLIIKLVQKLLPKYSKNLIGV
jgi:Predicted acyltransferases